MHPDTREVAEHMREFGLNLYGRALKDATFSEIMLPYNHAVAATIAAQSAEILIKSRIAQEHPLLIFKSLPRSTTTDQQLTLAELFEYGVSHQFTELPEQLWATTGIRMDRLQIFREFGKLRNSIMHFTVPEDEISARTLEFCINFLFPLIKSFWDINPFPYAEVWYEDIIIRGHLEYSIRLHEIPISTDLRAALGDESERESIHTYELSKGFRS